MKPAGNDLTRGEKNLDKRMGEVFKVFIAELEPHFAEVGDNVAYALRLFYCL